MGGIDEEPQIEEIADEDDVSRQIFRPHKFDELIGVKWDNAFIFKDGIESLVWRLYKPEINQVHDLGLQQQAKKIESEPATDFRYVGSLTACVANVRAIKTARGFECKIVHDPSNGQGRHHAEISVHHLDNQKTTRNDRADLRIWLKNAFNRWDSLAGM